MADSKHRKLWMSRSHMKFVFFHLIRRSYISLGGSTKKNKQNNLLVHFGKKQDAYSTLIILLQIALPCLRKLFVPAIAVLQGPISQ